MTSWKNDLSARERITRVVETVTDPVSINWVAEDVDPYAEIKGHSRDSDDQHRSEVV